MSFPTTLTLVSPHTHNKLVEEAQWLLTKKGNRWDGAYFTGRIDGTYGPLAGAASHRAKFYLGYPTKAIDNAFGTKLHAYLVNAKHPDFKMLPLTYQARRWTRLHPVIKKSPFTLGDKAISQAVFWIGYREVPTNRTTFGKWMGSDEQPWCGYFVSYCLTKAGHHFREGYVPTIVSDARMGRNNTYVVSDPRIGDLVCFDWEKNGEYDHVGFFNGWVNRTTGEFATIEGNTLPPGGSGNQSNGGGVYRRARDTRSANVTFVRVKG